MLIVGRYAVVKPPFITYYLNFMPPEEIERLLNQEDFDIEVRMRAIFMTLIFSLAVVVHGEESPSGLRDPVAKDIAMQLVSAAENSSLDWKAQYGYIEYNVEKNKAENRGYTAGIIGFTSRTGDMLELVQHYQKLAPENALTKYLPALQAMNGTPSQKGLGREFMKAWKDAAKDPKFQQAQNDERDRVYFEPAVKQAQADGLQPLGQFIYYDAIVMHGAGDDANSFGGIRASAIKHARLPSDGGDETAYLNAFLDARIVTMKTEQGHQDTTRVDTMQRKFVKEGNLKLSPPLRFKVYGDSYEIPSKSKQE